MTLKKPPTTLGENQFESFSLFSEYCLYSETEKHSKKFQQPNYRLISISVLAHRLRNCTKSTTFKTKKYYNINDINKCCTATSENMPESTVRYRMDYTDL